MRKNFEYHGKMGPIRQRLCVDCHGINPAFLESQELLYNFMVNLTKNIQMRVLVPPIIVKVPVENACESIYTSTDFGLSGIMIYLESSLSVHTQPELYFLSVDIYTCKKFDVNIALDTIKEYFNPYEMELTVNSVKERIE